MPTRPSPIMTRNCSSWLAIGTSCLSYVALVYGSCSATLTPTNSIKPSLASGYSMALVATGLVKPRSIQFDSAGTLLVVEQGAGLTALTLQDNGGVCLSVKSSKKVVQNTGVSF